MTHKQLLELIRANGGHIHFGRPVNIVGNWRCEFLLRSLEIVGGEIYVRDRCNGIDRSAGWSVLLLGFRRAIYATVELNISELQKVDNNLF